MSILDRPIDAFRKVAGLEDYLHWDDFKDNILFYVGMPALGFVTLLVTTYWVNSSEPNLVDLPQVEYSQPQNPSLK